MGGSRRFGGNSRKGAHLVGWADGVEGKRIDLTQKRQHLGGCLVASDLQPKLRS